MDVDNFFEKQAREQKAKSKFKGMAIRQHELKLMKAARKTKVHGDVLGNESTRELLRQIFRVFLEFGFSESAIQAISSFCPLYGWKDDIDALASETLYLTIRQSASDLWNYRNFNIECKEMQRTEMFGPLSSGKWTSIDGMELSHHEFSFRGLAFTCEEGFTPGKICNFVAKYGRFTGRERVNDIIKVFVSPNNVRPDDWSLPSSEKYEFIMASWVSSGVNLQSSFVRDIQIGKVFEVMETVRHNGRIRGRVADGWVTLYNLDSKRALTKLVSDEPQEGFE